jgi:hypothetical protein
MNMCRLFRIYPQSVRQEENAMDALIKPVRGSAGILRTDLIRVSLFHVRGSGFFGLLAVVDLYLHGVFWVKNCKEIGVAR